MYITLKDFFPLDKIYAESFILYIFDYFLLIFFFMYNYKRHGVFSFTSLWMFIFFFLGILFPFFFAFSNLNRMASPDIYLYAKYTNTTFLISSVGFYCFIIGTMLSNKIRFTPIGLNYTTKGLKGILDKKFARYFLIFFALMGAVLFLSLSVPFGNARTFSMEHTNLRPLINFFASLYASTLYIIWVIALYKKSKFYYFWLIVFFILNLWIGTRSVLIIPIVFMIATLSIVKQNKNIFKYIAYVIPLFLIGFLIKFFREGHANNITVEFIAMEFLFGNTFSDLRDFTWVYYRWDKEFLLGKTYFAGMISFIPSFISEYRDIWSWGRWSTNITFLNPAVHPGLRTGYFGEIYFNFGYLGVILLGGISGLFIGRLDKMLSSFRKISKNKKDLLFVTSTYFIYYSLIVGLCISAGYFNIYIKIAILFIGYFAYKTKIR